MSAGEHHWPRGNGNGEGTCHDQVARDAAEHAGNGVLELHGLVVGVEQRTTDRLVILGEALGLKDIRKRFARQDAEREAMKERRRATALASIPPESRPRTPSEIDRFERAVDRFNEGVERISSHDQLPGSKLPSDPALAKRVAWGGLVLGVRALRDILIEHWVWFAITSALGGGAGITHLLHVWHVLK